ncbi:hypothetical protein [Priestia megaterium]|uniref:hypothetical protein n=1 Tax=Priestia megaterium TaxID=1404 RepID=UPI00203B3BAB|nr:hypothetical protein [Priestia megaterium]MCM3182257.1 hypothetical protein [Priestia megaterium]
MIGGQDEDSCGKSGIGETPQELSDEEAHRPPAKRSLARKSTAMEQAGHISSFIQLVHL